MACSSAKISRSLEAMKVAREEEEDALAGIWFGV